MKLFKENCYIAEDGTVFAPNIEDGVVIETGYDVYKRHLEQIDICEKDRIKTNEELTEEQIKMQKNIADLEIESIINN